VKIYFIIIALFPFLFSCGGGGSSSSPNAGGTTASTTHAIQLGPIAGAAVTIYRPDCTTVLYQTTTDGAGNYNINTAQLSSAMGASSPEILCVESVGGKDIDPDDNGIVTADEAIVVQGKIRGFVKTADLLNTSATRINLFGNAIADMLSATDDISIARIEQLAVQLGVPDINNDGKIAIADVTQYKMGSNSNGEESLRSFYLRSIHDGNDSDRTFFINTSNTSIAAVRATYAKNNNNTLDIILTRYSRDGVIRYGSTYQGQLANIYTKPFTAAANELIYLQECRGDNCYPLQAVQVNSSATKFIEYTDSGGVDLDAYYSDEIKRKDLIAKITTTTDLLNTTTATITTNTQTITTLTNDVSKIDADIAALQAQIAKLQ
jgi:hypothetical protein